MTSSATLKEKGPKVEYMTAPIPRGPKRWGGMTQPWSIYVSKGKNMEAAWDFAQFLVSPPMAFKLTREVGWLSLREDVDWAPLLKETPQFKAVRPVGQGPPDLRRARPPGLGRAREPRWRTG